MTWELAAAIGTTLAGLTAVLGAPWAIISYWRSVRTRRAEWLTSLHEKFFETVTDHPFVITALGPQGFEKLPSLLKTIKPVISN